MISDLASFVKRAAVAALFAGTVAMSPCFGQSVDDELRAFRKDMDAQNQPNRDAEDPASC